MPAVRVSMSLALVKLLHDNGPVATPPLLKRLNEEAVLRTIRAGAPISRAQISRRAGISKPTVSLALQALIPLTISKCHPTKCSWKTYSTTYRS